VESGPAETNGPGGDPDGQRPHPDAGRSFESRGPSRMTVSEFELPTHTPASKRGRANHQILHRGAGVGRVRRTSGPPEATKGPDKHPGTPRRPHLNSSRERTNGGGGRCGLKRRGRGLCRHGRLLRSTPDSIRLPGPKARQGTGGSVVVATEATGYQIGHTQWETVGKGKLRAFL